LWLGWFEMWICKVRICSDDMKCGYARCGYAVMI
jgi:hypothetical protein